MGLDADTAADPLDLRHHRTHGRSLACRSKDWDADGMLDALFVVSYTMLEVLCGS